MVGIRQAIKEQLLPSREERIKLLVPVAGNDADPRLLTYVSRVSQRRNADIALIFVVEVDQELPLDAELPSEVTHGEDVLRIARETLRKTIDPKSTAVSTDMLQARAAGPAIVDEAMQDGTDIIIMGASVRKLMGKRTCGDTVDYVMRNAPCEVMILRAAMPESLLTELEMEIE